MAVATAAAGGLLAWRDRPGESVLFSFSVAFMVLALTVPALLRPLERMWMAFAGILGRIMTTVLLTITFFLVITPLGLLMRFFRVDLVGKRGDPSKDTYWVPAEPDGPGSRPTKPY